MGQKTNPILLRLEKTNQQWVSCWYNDHNYATQLINDYGVYTYIQNCSQQLKKNAPSFFIKRSRGGMEIALFFSRFNRDVFPLPFRFQKKLRRKNNSVLYRLLDKSKAKRSRRSNMHPFSSKPYQVTSLIRREGTRFKKQNLIEKKIRTLKNGLLLANVSYTPLLLQGGQKRYFPDNFVSSSLDNHIGQLHQHPPFSTEGTGWEHGSPSTGYKRIFSAIKILYPRGNPKGLLAFLPRKSKHHGERGHEISKLVGAGRRRIKTPLTTHLENSIRVQLGSRCKLYLLKCPSIHQNPVFLTSQIVDLLQKRVSFRQFKHRIIKQVSENATIKGIRIMCSGRVAARSKKAQKARRESIQWGCTGLNVFSELVHFASKQAQTAYGTIGVKLWICYKQPQHISKSPFPVPPIPCSVLGLPSKGLQNQKQRERKEREIYQQSV